MQLKFKLILTASFAFGGILTASSDPTSPALSDAQYAEFVAKTTHVYLLFDMDGDGTVTAEEYMNHPQYGVSLDFEPEEMLEGTKLRFLANDTDGDGAVSGAEFARKMFEDTLADFTALDADKNGMLSFVEFIHPQEGAEASVMGHVEGISFSFGATNEEVNSPHPYFHKGEFDANYSAYVGHAFARRDENGSFTLSLAEFAGVSEAPSGS